MQHFKTFILQNPSHQKALKANFSCSFLSMCKRNLTNELNKPRGFKNMFTHKCANHFFLYVEIAFKPEGEHLSEDSEDWLWKRRKQVTTDQFKKHTHRREYVAHTSASGSHFSKQFIQQEDNDPNKLKGLRPVKLVTGLWCSTVLSRCPLASVRWCISRSYTGHLGITVPF